MTNSGRGHAAKELALSASETNWFSLAKVLCGATLENDKHNTPEHLFKYSVAQ